MASSHHFFLAYEDNRVAGRFSERSGLLSQYWSSEFLCMQSSGSVFQGTSVYINQCVVSSNGWNGYQWESVKSRSKSHVEYRFYDSVENAWSRPGNMPPNIRLPLSLNFMSQAISIGSGLYFMQSDPEGIISYNMATGAWKQFIIPSPPLVADHSLAGCGGRIMLVDLLSKNDATCVCVWKLWKMTLLWKEVDRIPSIWSLEFYRGHIRMTCLGNKDLLMPSLRSRQMNRLIMYDMSKREWTKVPTCTVPHRRKRQWIACGRAFQACVTAVA